MLFRIWTCKWGWGARSCQKNNNNLADAFLGHGQKIHQIKIIYNCICWFASFHIQNQLLHGYDSQILTCFNIIIDYCPLLENIIVFWSVFIVLVYLFVISGLKSISILLQAFHLSFSRSQLLRPHVLFNDQLI